MALPIVLKAEFNFELVMSRVSFSLFTVVIRRCFFSVKNICDKIDFHVARQTMHASVNVGCQGKSGPGKIHEVILVYSVVFHVANRVAPYFCI